MSSLSRELVFLILQFLEEEEKFKESVHKLEKESGAYFNMKYFEDKVQTGEWEEVENYLSGFTKVDDNRYSMKIFFEIRKQKYLEALDRNDKAKAVEILVSDLKVFSTFNEELYKEIMQLLPLTNFRENEQLSKYGDTKAARSIMSIELKKLIEANPLFRDKLVFPTLKSSRLRTLINQSLNWQHQLCKNPRPNPDIKTLFMDHTCSPPNSPLAPTPVSLPVAKPAPYAPLGAHSSASERAALTSKEDLISRHMPERYAGPTSFDHVVGQDHYSEYGNKDLRHSGRSFDRSRPISPATPPPTLTSSLPSEKVLSEDWLRGLSLMAIQEFYSARDEEEVALCIKELNSPAFHPTRIRLWVTDAFKRTDLVRDLLAKLLVNLSKSKMAH